MSWASALGAVVGTIIDPGAGTAIGASIGGQIGGSSTSATSPCPGQPSTADVLHMLQAASAQEITNLRNYYAAANSNPTLPTDPFTLAKNAMGGSDCQAKSANAQVLKSYFLTLVQRYPSVAGVGFNGPGDAAAATTGNAAAGNGYNAVVTTPITTTSSAGGGGVTGSVSFGNQTPTWLLPAAIVFAAIVIALLLRGGGKRKRARR